MIESPNWLNLLLFVGAILGTVWYALWFAVYRRPNYLALTLIFLALCVGEGANLLKPGTTSSLISRLLDMMPGGRLLRSVARELMWALVWALIIVLAFYPKAIFRGGKNKRK